MLSKTSLKAVSAVALAASALLVGAASAAPAFATTPAATYGTWSEPTGDAVTGFTGTVTFGTSGISNATYATTFGESDPYNDVTVHDNSSEWMSPQTPFGAVFGPSGPSADNSFLRVDVYDTETTVVTFDTPVPADRIGLAIGDLDLDTAVISGTDGTDAPLTDTQLKGSSTTNGFNLCTVTDSIPTVCSSGGPWTEAPVMTSLASSVTFDPNVEGQDIGVTGWISPSAEVKSLTIFHTSHSAGSSLRFWLAGTNDAVPATPSVLANTAAPESGVALWVALALGLLGMGGLVAANRRKVNA